MSQTPTASFAIDRLLVAVESVTLFGGDPWSVLATVGATVPNSGARVRDVGVIRSEHAKWLRRSRRVRAGAPAEIRWPDGQVQRHLGQVWRFTRLAPSAGPHHRQRPAIADTVPGGGRWPAALLTEMGASSG